MLYGTKNAIFMIEGGLALKLVQEHISDRIACDAAAKELCSELGVKDGRRSLQNGKLTRVVFPGAVPKGWTIPDKYGCSRPKRGTEWAKRFAAQVGYHDQSDVISKAFNIPLSVGFTQEHGEGFTCIGNMLTECGFLYLSANGPYAMWCPDVPEIVAAIEREGDKQVKGLAKSFRLDFDGCRRIHYEEWELLVAQHNLAKKMAGKENANG